VVVTDVDLDSAERTASRLESAKALRLDVTDPTPVTPWSTPSSRARRLDVWVSNAGISKMQRFIDVSPADLVRNFEVNTYGIFTAANRRRGP